MDRVSRKEIMKETLQYIENNQELSKNIKYKNYDMKNYKHKENIPNFNTNIEVISDDTLYSTINYQLKYKEKFCFLIFANAFHPGGGYLRGAMAQEESIARRTNLALAFPDSKLYMKPLKYPLSEYGGAFIKNIAIFRNSERDNCKFINTVYSNAILAALYSQPQVELIKTKNNEEYYRDFGRINKYTMKSDKYKQTEQKICAILDIAIENKQENLILGAIGCGAFANPPYDIANIFKKLLKTKYRNKFKNVIFSIPKSNTHKNYEIFFEVFQTFYKELKNSYINKNNSGYIPHINDFPPL